MNNEGESLECLEYLKFGVSLASRHSFTSLVIKVKLTNNL